MKDENKTKEKLIEELRELRQRIAELEASETELMQADSALQPREEYLQSLVGNISDVLAIINADATIRFVSSSSEKVLGYKPEEVIGRNAFNFVHPDDLSAVVGVFNQGIKVPGYATSMEYRLQHRDGSWRTFEIMAKNLLDNPAVQGIVVTYLDITERKRAEQELRVKDSAIASSINAIAIADLEGILTYVNSSFLKLWGYDSEKQVLGKSATQFWDVQEKVLGVVEALRHKGSWVGELIARRKDGSLFNAQLSASTVTDNVGEPICMMASFLDITERKQTEEALQQSERLYHLLADNVIDVIYTLDMNLKFNYFSPSVARLRGYSVKESMAQTLEDVLTPSSLKVVMKAFTEELALEKMEYKDLSRSRTLELEVIRKDGSTVWTEMKMTFLRDPDGQPVGIVGVARDITERKQAEETLKKLYEHERELRESVEAEMKRRVEFTRALVHELRTPLTPMIASSQLLIEELDEGISLKLAKNVKEGAVNLGKRIDELLDVARGELGIFELNCKHIDPLQLFQMVADEIAPVASSREQSLVVELPSSLPLVQADEGRLRQVLQNLFSNALKWTPQGGKVTLRAKEKDNNLIVEVQDTGPGIPKEKQQKIFEGYYHAEDDRQGFNGLGLGLSLCKTIIELHGGEVWVKSDVGKGATFGFTLPLELDG